MKAELSPQPSQPSQEKEGGRAGGKEGGGEGSEGQEPAAEQAKEGGAESKDSIKVEYLPLDLSSFQSTIDCVRVFKEKGLPLHILINNAGIAFTPYSECTVYCESLCLVILSFYRENQRWI